nr:MAG TPA: hypothetical protein [Caudoviricetes sp.]
MTGSTHECYASVTKTAHMSAKQSRQAGKDKTP